MQFERRLLTRGALRQWKILWRRRRSGWLVREKRKTSDKSLRYRAILDCVSWILISWLTSYWHSFFLHPAIRYTHRFIAARCNNVVIKSLYYIGFVATTNHHIYFYQEWIIDYSSASAATGAHSIKPSYTTHSVGGELNILAECQRISNIQYFLNSMIVLRDIQTLLHSSSFTLILRPIWSSDGT